MMLGRTISKVSPWQGSRMFWSIRALHGWDALEGRTTTKMPADPTIILAMLRMCNPALSAHQWVHSDSSHSRCRVTLVRGISSRFSSFTADISSERPSSVGSSKSGSWTLTRCLQPWFSLPIYKSRPWSKPYLDQVSGSFQELDGASFSVKNTWRRSFTTSSSLATLQSGALLKKRTLSFFCYKILATITKWMTARSRESSL